MSTLHCIFRLCSTLTAPPPALHARTCAMSPLQHCGSWFWQLAVDFAGAGAGTVDAIDLEPPEKGPHGERK